MASLARQRGISVSEEKKKLSVSEEKQNRDLLHRNVKNYLRKKVKKKEVTRLGEVGDGGYGTKARCTQMCRERGLSSALRTLTCIYSERDVLEAMQPQTNTQEREQAAMEMETAEEEEEEEEGGGGRGRRGGQGDEDEENDSDEEGDDGELDADQ
jgi:hypothetical protein